MTLVFKYKAVKRPDGTEVKTPSIPVVLRWKQQLDTIALLDSGADVSAMPSAIAEILGCDLEGRKSSAYMGLAAKWVPLTQKSLSSLKKGTSATSSRCQSRSSLAIMSFPFFWEGQDFLGILLFHLTRQRNGFH